MKRTYKCSQVDTDYLMLTKMEDEVCFNSVTTDATGNTIKDIEIYIPNKEILSLVTTLQTLIAPTPFGDALKERDPHMYNYAVRTKDKATTLEIRCCQVGRALDYLIDNNYTL